MEFVEMIGQRRRNRRSPAARTLAAAAAIAALAYPIPASAGPSQYTVVALGVAGEAYAVNDHGVAVGAGQLPGTRTHAFRWERGVITDLGVLETGPFEYGRATDVDRHGRIVGFSVVNGDPEQSGSHAFQRSDGVVSDLGTVGTESMAFAINDRGEVVGVSYAGGVPHIVVWRGGELTDVDTGYATDINDHGVIIGRRDSGGEVRPCVWRDGQATYLDVPDGYYGMQTVAVNNRGWLLSRAMGIAASRSLLWRDGTVTDLGTLGGAGTWAAGMNDRGEVFGVSTTWDGAVHPFLWRDGRMTDLTTLGVPEDAVLNAINNHGDLVGSLDGIATLFRPGRRYAAVIGADGTLGRAAGPHDSVRPPGPAVTVA